MGATGTLGSGVAGIGGLLTTLGSGTAWRVLGWVWRLFCCSFAFAVAVFAVAIFVNNLLSFFDASAVSPLRETNPFNALVSSDATFMMSVLGATCGFIYVLVFEEHCVANSCCPRFHSVDVETSVMRHCHPNVETGICVDIPGLLVLGFDVGHHHASQGCKQAFQVVVLPMDMGICRHFWGNIALL